MCLALACSAGWLRVAFNCGIFFQTTLVNTTWKVNTCVYVVFCVPKINIMSKGTDCSGKILLK